MIFQAILIQESVQICLLGSPGIRSTTNFVWPRSHVGNLLILDTNYHFRKFFWLVTSTVAAPPSWLYSDAALTDYFQESYLVTVERTNFCIEVKTAHKTGRNLNRAFYIWKFGHWRQSGQNQGPKKYQKQHHMLVNIISVITGGNCGKNGYIWEGGVHSDFSPKK